MIYQIFFWCRLTWWRLFHKRTVRTKFVIYVFIGPVKRERMATIII